MSTFPTDNIWFTKFITGVEKRIRIQESQDIGICIDVILKVQNYPRKIGKRL